MAARITMSLLAMALVVAACQTPTTGPNGHSPTSPVEGTASPTTTTEASTLTVKASDYPENLIAFSRLINYVRFFHPSDEAAETDWALFTLASLEAVEQAGNPDALAALLETQIQSVAPSVRVFPTTNPPSLEAIQPPDNANQAKAWLHRGVGTAEVVSSSRVFSSERIVVSADPVDWPDWFPSPATPLKVDLGSGVSALVPLAVYAVDGVTAPTPVTPGVAWLDAEPPLLAYGDSSRDDRATRCKPNADGKGG